MMDIHQLQTKLEQLKTQLAIEQHKYNEALATLQTTFGVDNLNTARNEYNDITTKIIPQLQLKRDNMLAKAEAILNGIDTQNQKAGAAQPRGILGPGNAGGAKTGRQLVGLRRDN